MDLRNLPGCTCWKIRFVLRAGILFALRAWRNGSRTTSNVPLAAQKVSAWVMVMVTRVEISAISEPSKSLFSSPKFPAPNSSRTVKEEQRNPPLLAEDSTTVKRQMRLPPHHANGLAFWTTGTSIVKRNVSSHSLAVRCEDATTPAFGRTCPSTWSRTLHGTWNLW